jgi:hypothetical protein
MREQGPIKKKSEEDFEEIEFSKFFSNLLNFVALCVIVCIMCFFYSAHYSKIEERKVNTEFEIKFVSNGSNKIDNESLNNLLNERLTGFKEQIKDAEKERNESLKYYSTIVGFVLTIVGFFGFKSIHDTRQASIEKAVFDAKKESEKIAKIIAEAKAEEIASKEAKKVAIETSKNEIERYLTDEKEEIFRLLENPIKDSYDPIILDYKDRLDRLERPGIYNKEINDLNDKIYNMHLELNNKINELKRELIEKEVELLKLKIQS